MDDQTGILKKTKEVLTDSDETLGEKAPGTPFILVALSYLAILAAVCLIFALAMWISR